jgi:hypothetical protein
VPARTPAPGPADPPSGAIVRDTGDRLALGMLRRHRAAATAAILLQPNIWIQPLDDDEVYPLTQFTDGRQILDFKYGEPGAVVRPGSEAQSVGWPRMTRGQDGSLLLSCATPSLTTPRRFIPAHHHGLLTKARLLRIGW